MIDKSHTQLNLNFLEEYEDFYDFTDIYEKIRKKIEQSILENESNLKPDVHDDNEHEN